MKNPLTFSAYLIEQFQEYYQGWDDNWPEAEEKWYSELDDTELSNYFEDFMWQENWFFIRQEDWEKAINYIHSLL